MTLRSMEKLVLVPRDYGETVGHGKIRINNGIENIWVDKGSSKRQEGEKSSTSTSNSMSNSMVKKLAAEMVKMIRQGKEEGEVERSRSRVMWGRDV